MLIFSRQNRFKCCNLHDLFYIYLDNGVMTTPKRRILSFVFTVLCFKKCLLIRIFKQVLLNLFHLLSTCYKREVFFLFQFCLVMSYLLVNVAHVLLQQSENVVIYIFQIVLGIEVTLK